MSKIKTLKEIDVKEKRVLLRADLNARWRIEAVVPTLKYLIKQKAKIILISHLGRPHGRRVKKLSLKPVSDELGRILKKKILFSKQITGRGVEKKIERMKFGDILMLENIRFSSGEEKNSPGLAKELVKLGDLFINDAFAVSHRKHASIVGIPEFLPSVIGPLFEKEVRELDKILKNPKRPLVAIIGGAKIVTKIKTINKLLTVADRVLIGGALANDIFAARGIFMGNSMIDKDSFSEVKEINLKNTKLFLPIDLGIWNGKEVFYRDFNELKEKEKALDIGPKTVEAFCDVIKNSKTVIWNGPLGLYTQKPFDKSSKAMVETISKSRTHSVVGGGDTVAFLREIKKEKIFNHVSTGGGSMLEYIAHGTLPGIIALDQ